MRALMLQMVHHSSSSQTSPLTTIATTPTLEMVRICCSLAMLMNVYDVFGAAKFMVSENVTPK
jgi:hypothetical protein